MSHSFLISYFYTELDIGIDIKILAWALPIEAGVVFFEGGVTPLDTLLGSIIKLY